MLSDEQLIEQIRTELRSELADLNPPPDLLDRLLEPAESDGRSQRGSSERPAHWRGWRARVRGLGAAVPVLAAVVVAVLIAVVALSSLGRDHIPGVPSSGATGPEKYGQITLDDPGHCCGSGSPAVESRVELVSPDGSGLRDVTYPCPRLAVEGGECTVDSFAWSRDGRRLAYLAGVERVTQPSEYTLYLVGANGQSRRLTACGSCSDVSWSPDGSQVAVGRDTGGRSGIFNVWVVNATTGAMRRLTDCSPGPFCGAFEPQWSPSGQAVLFAWSGKGHRSLATIRPDGSHLTTIITTDADDPSARWSPDGREIAFDEKSGIYVVNADGTDLRRIVARGVEPAWSPDGTRLIYTTRVFEPGTRSQLWMINADGSHNRVLYRPPTRHTCCVAKVWSPDGRQIAFSRGGGTYVINADGTGLHRIGPDSPILAWQPMPLTH
jgi:dipeptidyl aminopeptidase/acylaminoacyl peptidase